MASNPPTPWTPAERIIDEWIGPDYPTEIETVRAWVARAERLIRREFPALSARIAAGQEEDLLETVRDVVASMVTRVLRNPAGYRTVNTNTGTGPFTGGSSATFAGTAPGTLALTDDERASLTAPGQAQAGKAFSFSMVGGPITRHAQACSVNFGAYCSCGADIAGSPLYGVDGDEA